MTNGIISTNGRYNVHMTPRYAMLSFGKALKIRRDRLGMTQAALAEKMGGAVDQSTVSKWEVRATPLRDRFLLDNLAEALDATVQDLIEGRVPAEWAGIVTGDGLELLGSEDDYLTQFTRRYAPHSSPDLIRQAVGYFDKLDAAGRKAAITMLRALAEGEAEEM